MSRREPQIGRPRSFDEAAILDKIVPVFFENGFAGANFEMLETATGLHRQSLRYAYGDKRAMFRSSLARYADTKTATIQELLSRDDAAIAGIAAVLRMWTEDARRRTCRGCFLVSTMADRSMAGVDEIRKTVEAANRRILALLASAFERAQQDGDVRTDIEAETLARTMLALGDGVMLLGKPGMPVADISNVFDGFLQQIRP